MTTDQYEGVAFDDGVDELVALQLQRGIHRHKYDDGPGDWLFAAWEALSEPGRRRLAAAVHRALLHESPDVRAGALGMLEVNRRMRIPQMLLTAGHHFELFRGLRHSGDPPDRDRGHDLVRLVSGCCQGEAADGFRREMALDPVYGDSVLSAPSQ